MKSRLINIGLLVFLIIDVAIFGLLLKITVDGEPQNEEIPPIPTVKIEVEQSIIAGEALCGYLISTDLATLDVPEDTTMILFVDESHQRHSSIGVVTILDIACWGAEFQSGHTMTPVFYTGEQENLRLVGMSDPVLVELKIKQSEVPGNESRPASQSQA